MPMEWRPFDTQVAGGKRGEFDAMKSQWNDYGGWGGPDPYAGLSDQQIYKQALGDMTPQQYFDKNYTGPGREYNAANNSIGMMNNTNFELSPAMVAGAMFGLAGPAIAAGGAAGSGGWATASNALDAPVLGSSASTLGTSAAAGGGMPFDPFADFGADYFSGASNYAGGSLMPPAQLDPSVADFMKAGNTAGGGSMFTADGLNQSVLGLGTPSTGFLDTLRNLSANPSGLTSLLGKLGASGLQAYASNRQGNQLGALAQQYAGYGAPSRARYEASMTPGFDPTSIPGYSGALDTASKSILARLSASGGNPYGSPGALIDANKAIVSGTALPAMQEYQRTNLNAGGLANMNAAIPGLQTGAIGADSNVLAALGAGLGSATAPDTSLAALLKQLKDFNLNSGTGLT